MFIAINGQLGSGKSEICRRLNKYYGYDVFCTGDIQRKFAEELGISTLELNEKAKSDFSFDYAIDKALVEYAEKNRGKNVIFDSRMAWHFVKSAFKIHLLISPFIAADRVFGKRKSVAEDYSTKEETMRELIQRRMVENERYAMVYNVQMGDYNNYNLLLDTSTLTPDETCKIIIDESKAFLIDENRRYVSVSTINIYPTKPISALDTDKIDRCIDKIKNGSSLKIKLLPINDSFYIFEGHEEVIALNRCGVRQVDADIVEKNTVSNAIFSTREIVAEWEKFNGFVFGFYPDAIK